MGGFQRLFRRPWGQGKTEIFHVSLIGLLFGLYHEANEKNNNEPPYEGPLTLYADDYTI